MPDEGKKSSNIKNAAKDKKKPQPKPQPAVESKVEKKHDTYKDSKQGKQSNEGTQESFKRETILSGEVINISGEDNAKYKKKEIVSNWSKYDMPVETYEEIDQQESLGADYEKLIQAPMSIGGHFQFKHEKTWDENIGPSLYDKYFEINMDSLGVALSSIPFYDRNSIDKSIFTESDILTMDHRSIKYKQKYYNNKSFTTPELDIMEKTLKSLRDDSPAEDAFDNNHKSNLNLKDKIDNKSEIVEGNSKILSSSPSLVSQINEKVEDKLGYNRNTTEANSENLVPKAANATMESPEDLEKWLDDFLDG